MKKIVMKTKTFDRWAKKIVSSTQLCKAAREIELEYYEADLGGGVCKKRIPILGQGKSGSIRTIVAKKNRDAIIFIVGREKSDSGSDFTNNEQTAAIILAKTFEKADRSKLQDLVDAGILKELICND
ncbi:type II toxin-antitoxin system RelE/ParE family toxin [Polynucleobacter sp. MWH-Mekk-B1]|jgi:hypothetical protein|uniref:type II toxin-antitoxin system RelE/ParE family toxin n=1 Tax=Polynucleobacter finlandensis TaxID=1855894 RepID=UPI001C0AA77A|nr:type II toxin-antitoxin system RelE/ParE family toxin [Polynucleobacter finlandensis]MBU3545030.1 type II toxin-antitoxin system RelE/ParE family toxin [Polynucleobacter finlandensis]